MFPHPSPLLMSSGGATLNDPYLSSVVLLSGFEGANASTTFVDESPVARTLTAVGNAQVTTSQFQFGSSSATFDGTGDYITAPDSADWAFNATEQFTVEGWYRFLVKQSSQALIGQWDNAGGTSNSAWFFYITGGNLTFKVVSSASTFTLGAAFVPTLGTWYHLACDRTNSDGGRIYVNGSMVAKSALVTGSDLRHAANNSTSPLSLGRIGSSGTTFSAFDFNGQMDEVRVTKGVARYASDAGFTVPTAAFPRI